MAMSRTHQYRKVMKPLLERKRRARINKCLDELKDLMVYALQSEGENITKLEKADVLEMTVNHLHKLKRQQMLKSNPALDLDRYRSGFTACANEVSRCLASIPGMNIGIGTTLMSHLGASITTIEKASQPLSVNTITSSTSSMTSNHHISTSSSVIAMAVSPSSDGGYNSGRESVSPNPMTVKSEGSLWRPF